MASIACLRNLRTCAHRFAPAVDGGVLITFALALIPLVGLVGAAIDYSRAAAIRTSLQAVTDATALAIAKNASSQSAADLQSSATNYFKAQYTRPDSQDLQIKATYIDGQTEGSSSSVTVNASAVMKTNFMGILGFTQIPLSVSSVTKWGNVRLRVALVLDNTGSMSDSGKMSALKTATKNLLDQLKKAAVKNGDVYVSIIPFNTSVNVGGPGNYNANWIDWSDWDDNNGSDVTSQSCTTTTGRNGKRTRRCTTSSTWVPDNHNTWNGCITDRDKDYDTKNTTPSSATPATLFPAEPDASTACPTELMPLSYNWTQLNKKIDDMSPGGATNQTIGLVWGWQSLSQTSPLNAPALDANYTYQQVIILLSDGLNTQNRWDGNGRDPAPEVDARERIACTNIKAAKFTIYTILVMAGNSSILQDCASDKSKYYMLTSANQIITAFDNIAKELSQLRVAK